MKLYHGTSARFLDKILRNGLQPRRAEGQRTRKSQWEVKSCDEAIYLTDAYAPYFSINACNKQYREAAIIEIDTDKLDLFDFVPDEDVLEQSLRNKDELPADWSMQKRTEYYRDNLMDWADGETWQKSLLAMGTCAHMGTIPVEAITRIATFDTSNKDMLWLSMTFMGPSISLMNYHFVGNKYRYYSARLMGRDPEPKDFPQKRLEGDLPQGWNEAMRWEFDPEPPFKWDLIKIVDY